MPLQIESVLAEIPDDAQMEGHLRGRYTIVGEIIGKEIGASDRLQWNLRMALGRLASLLPGKRCLAGLLLFFLALGGADVPASFP